MIFVILLKNITIYVYYRFHMSSFFLKASSSPALILKIGRSPPYFLGESASSLYRVSLFG